MQTGLPATTVLVLQEKKNHAREDFMNKGAGAP